MAIYAKLENGSLTTFKNPLIVGDTMHFNPTDEMLKEAGWKPYVANSIDQTQQNTCDVTASYEDNGETIERVYAYVFNPAKTQKYMTDAIQEYMDSKAQALGYDNINSVCTYIDTGVEKFDIEGEAFRKWRSAVWAFGYAYLDKALSGEATIPNSAEEFIEILPELNIVYPEDAE